MRAKVEGFTLEGTPSELMEFMRAWIQARTPHHEPLKKEDWMTLPKTTEITDKRDYEQGYKHPCTQPGCERRFQKEQGLKRHLTVVHHAHAWDQPNSLEGRYGSTPRAPSFSPLSEQGRAPDELRNMVISRLYPRPNTARLELMQGKTTEKLAGEVHLDKEKVSLILWKASEQGLVAHTGDGRGPNGYLWFRVDKN